LSFSHFLLVIILLVHLSFSFGHCVACPSATQWPKKTTEGQATKWPKKGDRRTSNTMTKGKGQKDKQHNDQSCLSFCPFLLAMVLLVLLSFSFGHCVACPSVPFLWPLCCLSFCPFYFGLCEHKDQKKRDRRTSNTMAKEKEQTYKQHNGQKKLTEGQATQ
jgi:hypothetical protein